MIDSLQFQSPWKDEEFTNLWRLVVHVPRFVEIWIQSLHIEHVEELK